MPLNSMQYIQLALFSLSPLSLSSLSLSLTHPLLPSSKNERGETISHSLSSQSARQSPLSQSLSPLTPSLISLSLSYLSLSWPNSLPVKHGVCGACVRRV